MQLNSLAIDLGGTWIKLALVQDGGVSAKIVLPANSAAGLKARLPEIERAAADLIGKGPVEMAGIAYPGIVNSAEKRVTTSCQKYDDALDFDFPQWCRSAFGCGAILENDANAALVGEVAYGVAQGCGDAVILILGTGVGTAAMMGGRLIRGRHFQAGCLGGHFKIPGNDRACSCGKRGCMEANASGWALPLAARQKEGFSQSGLRYEKAIDFLALEKWYRQGDRLAASLLDQFAECWSACAVDMIHAYDPQVVILSGGPLKFKGLFEMIRERASQQAWTPWGTVDFRMAAKPGESVLLGLHSLAEDALRAG